MDKLYRKINSLLKEGIIMNKEQFLDELEKLLQDIDSIERDEA